MMKHRASRIFAAAVLLPAVALGATGADAKKKKAPKEEKESEADIAFAKSFLGREYSGDFDIDGWTDLGGGLVSPPIYVRQYKRDDGTVLVLTSKETVKATKDK